MLTIRMKIENYLIVIAAKINQLQLSQSFGFNYV